MPDRYTDAYRAHTHTHTHTHTVRAASITEIITFWRRRRRVVSFRLSSAVIPSATPRFTLGRPHPTPHPHAQQQQPTVGECTTFVPPPSVCPFARPRTCPPEFTIAYLCFLNLILYSNRTLNPLPLPNPNMPNPNHTPTLCL